MRELVSILNSSPESVLAENGKSFYFSTIFLGHEVAQKVSRLYQLCRFIDDCADELSPEESKNVILDLDDVLSSMDMGSGAPFFRSTLSQEIYEAYVKAVSDVVSFGVSRSDLMVLLEGAKFDQGQVAIETEMDFMTYCHRVAGVVGEMMCPLLGCKDPRAKEYAKKLGMAMQMTNICRDVLEDAQRGRVYLMREVLHRQGLEGVPQGSRQTPVSLKRVIKFHLDLADHFYREAYLGLSYLPLKSRLCVLLAGEIYRGIGTKIRKNDFEVFFERSFLTFSEKIFVTLKSMGFLLKASFWRRPKFLQKF